ncbi:centromere protein H (CENP-H)-domain-containing protein [Diplogelasinospora grovesii]|uniref:Centromere protein H (CENP-H)-domain-containing protein n=1 Tax=Diplogelasinospora grovesii TaxID=303347 RepID=A0AAN6S5F5_9PEZI|nr:centromere protein H (CENP-H)-domain-containing protein [Diplogelasinospora grovesii]
MHNINLVNDGSSSRTPEALFLSDSEKRVLELYDRLQQLRLELALLRAQKQDLPDALQDVPEPDIDDSQRHLLESKAAHSLRNDVVESAIMIQPLLKAVHNGTHASPVERDLLPWAQQRDMTAVEVAKQCSDLQATRTQLAELEVQSLELSRRNVELASQALRLAEHVQAYSMESVGNMPLKQQIGEVENGLKASRARWKIIKGAASAVVAGSGIDWARDKHLRDIVLDPN